MVSGSGFDRVLLLGPEGSGKTSLLYMAKMKERISTLPTIGFNVETIYLDDNGGSFNVWDIGGSPRIIYLWTNYIDGAKGVIFVVDSSDVISVANSKSLLSNISKEFKLDGFPVVILANKQDIENSMPIEEIAREMDLNSIENINWKVIASSVNNIEGFMEGLIWIKNSIKTENSL